MSLFGALQLGKASLAAQQVGLEVTGNNIANAGTTGYSRQVARLSPTSPREVGSGQYVGTGVAVTSIERQVNEAIESSLREATSDLIGSQTMNDMLARIETVFGPLGENDLSARLQEFFNNFTTLANNPADAGQRSVVVQGGVSLAAYVRDVRSRLLSIRDDVQMQIAQSARQADTLVRNIAELNGKIAPAEASGGSANTLRDQRDQLLTDLAKIMDIRVIDTGNGMINVLSGSIPLVQGTVARPIGVRQVADATGTMATTELVFADNNDPLPTTGGAISALISTRDVHVTDALNMLDTFSTTLITAVNSAHTQGQGLAGFASVTGATQVIDPSLALNDAVNTIGFANTPVNGTFKIHVKDLATGLISTRQVTVNLSGAGTQTTLNSLAASISGGAITASVDGSGRLVIAANGNNSFTFSDDTSGVLAALGLNTFFTGKDAQSIAVNGTLTKSPDLLASGRDNTAGSNKNAQVIALAYSATSAALGGISLRDFYGNYIGTLAAAGKTAADDAKAQSVIKDSLFAQREAFSGVSLDEEAINLTKYQRAFQGSARYISVVNEMMDVVLSMAR